MLKNAKIMALTYNADFCKVILGAIMVLIVPEESLYVSY